MLLSNIEYVALRIARRFLVTDAFLLRSGHWFPYYRVNHNQLDSECIVERYLGLLAPVYPNLTGRQVLEIGAGSTNSTAYALAARTSVKHVFVHEPFVPLQPDLDSRLLEQCASAADISPRLVREKVARVADTSAVLAGSVDLILSHSVLEHVSEPAALFRESARLLKPDGAMLHIVDYRDHFFKYPYHFLQFTRGTWERLLNPGDLPRWRLGDHLSLLRNTGFDVTVRESTSDKAAFATIRPYLSADFDASDPALAIQTAVIFAMRYADLAR